MSVTSAFAFGYSQRFCAEGCHLTPLSAYFDSAFEAAVHRARRTAAMLLAGSSLKAARSPSIKVSPPTLRDSRARPIC